jgi:hypothetical protein
VTKSAALDLTAPEPDLVEMSKLSLIPEGGDTPPVPLLPKAPTTSDPAGAHTEGAVMAAVFAAKRPLAARSGAPVSMPPNAAMPPAAYRYFRNVQV